MEQNLAVLQGKVFIVDIQSMFGSTDYGWCLTSLPSGIILMAAENISSGRGSVTQRFYFGAVSSETVNADIQFSLICWSDFTKITDTYTAHVSIVPSDGAGYTPYSENANVKYGYACNEVPSLKYGFPCEQANVAKAAMPYGMIYMGNSNQNTPIFSSNAAANTPIFSNSVANTPIFSNNIPVLKYGFPGCC